MKKYEQNEVSDPNEEGVVEEASQSLSHSRAPSSDIVCAMIVGCDDHANLTAVLRALIAPIEDLTQWYPGIPRSLAPEDVYLFVSRFTWRGTEASNEAMIAKAKEQGISVVQGEWKDEASQRIFAQEYCLKKELYAFGLVVDTDEVMPPRLLAEHLNLAKGNAADRFYCSMVTLWGDRRHRVYPPEPLKALTMIRLDTAKHQHVRAYSGGREMVIDECCGQLWHLSYVRSDEDLGKKLANFSHRDEIRQRFMAEVWSKFRRNPLIRYIHPTHPANYDHLERIPSPRFLDGCWDEVESFECPAIPKRLRGKKVSVVIPLFGGPDDIRACLRSLMPLLQNRANGLVYEIIVVDDCSPDDAADVVAAEFPEVKLIRQKENRGFGATCNRGYAASRGQYIVFLNSDTIVTHAGWVRLLETLTSRGSVGAAGPMTNNAAYEQWIFAPYQLENVDLFAKDFAHRDAEDRDVPMLVGFCLAVKRSVLEEIDGPPFDEQLGKGLFEDNDICLRIQMAGYSCRLSERAFIHHHGSRSLPRMDVHPEIQLERAKSLFHEKWQLHILLGGLSHLPGQSEKPIVMREDRFPERWLARIRERARYANISLVMIVRNGGEGLAAALKSVAPICRQMIVLDTGSVDDSVAVARSLGAEVYEKEWVDFADARNYAQQYATGDWILWIDADDEMTMGSYEPILEGVLSAPADIFGLMFPVRFPTNSGASQTDGVQVDHVKIFRNHPEARWEYPIHEQILPSIGRLGGRVAALPGALVMHSHYDTSSEGQALKRIRDWRLLARFHEEYPDHPYAHFCSGMSHYYNAGHENWTHQKAIEHLERCLELSTPADSHVRKVYALLAQTDRAILGAEAAIERLRQGLDVCGEDPELRFQLGLCLTDVGRTTEALAEYEKIAPKAEGEISSLDIGILGPKRDYNMASILISLGRHREAADRLRAAIAVGFAAAAHMLFADALGRGDLRVANEALEAMQTMEGYSPAWVEGQIRVAADMGRDPISIFADAVRRRPGDIAPRVELSRRLLAAGQLAVAENHLRYLAAAGVIEGALRLHDLALLKHDLNLARQCLERARELGAEVPGLDDRLRALAV